MAGRGPAPKPAHLRQRTNKKAGNALLEPAESGAEVPAIPNPDERRWHPLTESWWGRVWVSHMAAQYLPTDMDGLGRLAILVDEYYRKPAAGLMAEIRLQESRFGLSPLDRSRLQWEIKRGEDAERARGKSNTPARPTSDPRKLLRMVNG